MKKTWFLLLFFALYTSFAYANPLLSLSPETIKAISEQRKNLEKEARDLSMSDLNEETPPNQASNPEDPNIEVEKELTFEEKIEQLLMGMSSIEKGFYEKSIAKTPGANPLDPKHSIKQFGYSLFSKKKSHSLNVYNHIPVSDTYVLGPGDELIIRLWGKIEETLTETIDKNGNIFLPRIGHITLSGSTYKESKKIIDKAFSKLYVNFDLSVTMGQLKTIRVFILGDVSKPGSYNISSMSTLMDALYQSGISKSGSLRNIQLRRNHSTIKTIDLYRFILKGDFSQDPKLKANDTIYIPPINNVVKIHGSTNKAALFETKKNDTLHTVLYDYAGGPNSNALLKFLTITRHENGSQKVLTIDTENTASLLKSTVLKNGDSIFIPEIDIDNIDGVFISGEIQVPGYYEKKDKLTLAGLIKKANNFRENAYPEEIKISRLTDALIRETIFINYNKTPNFPLKNKDRIIVYNAKDYGVSVEGAVKKEGVIEIGKKLTLRDAIYRCDGFAENAHITLIQISRLKPDFTRETLFINFSKNPSFPMQSRDKVTIYNTENYKGPKKVYIEGAVRRNGTYPFTDNMTILDLLNFGSLTEEAELSNAELFRNHGNNNEEVISLDLRNIHLNPNDPNNILLQESDRLEIRRQINATRANKITLSGEFNYPGVYYIQHNETLESIIKRAGGFTNRAFIPGAQYTKEIAREAQINSYDEAIEEESKRLIYEQNNISAASAFAGSQYPDAALLSIIKGSYQSSVEYIEKQKLKTKGRVIVDLNNTTQLQEIIVNHEDTLHIPEIPASIQVVGGVQNPTSILYKPSKKPKYYIKEAGYFSRYAVKRKVYVFKADGSLVFNPKVIERGDTIYVPEKIKINQSWLAITKELLNIISAGVSTSVLINSLFN